MTWYPQNAPWLITSVGFNRRKCLSSFYPSKDNWSILMLKLPYQVIPLDRVFRRPIKRTHVDFQNCQIRTTTLFEVIDLSPSSRDLIFFFIFIFFFSSWFLLYTWRCKGRRSSGRFTCVRRVQISFFDSFRMDGHRQFIFWHSDRSGIAVRSRSRIWSNTFTGEITVTIPHIAFHWLLKWIITTLKKIVIFFIYFFFFVFVQWLGEPRLRSLMEGRIVLVKLLCKDTANARIGVFSPCIAFRVAGSPGNSFYFIPYPKIFLSISGDAMNLIHYRLSPSKMICIARHAMGSSLQSLGYIILFDQKKITRVCAVCAVVCKSFYFLNWEMKTMKSELWTYDTHNSR